MVSWINAGIRLHEFRPIWTHLVVADQFWASDPILSDAPQHPDEKSNMSEFFRIFLCSLKSPTTCSLMWTNRVALMCKSRGMVRLAVATITLPFWCFLNHDRVKKGKCWWHRWPINSVNGQGHTCSVASLRPRRGNNLCHCDGLIWQGDHRELHKYQVVWFQHKRGRAGHLCFACKLWRRPMWAEPGAAPEYRGKHQELRRGFMYSNSLNWLLNGEEMFYYFRYLMTVAKRGGKGRKGKYSSAVILSQSPHITTPVKKAQ